MDGLLLRAVLATYGDAAMRSADGETSSVTAAGAMPPVGAAVTIPAASVTAASVATGVARAART